MNHILPDNRLSARNILVSCGSPERYGISLPWAGRLPGNHMTVLSWSAQSRRRLEIFEAPLEHNQDESRRDRAGHVSELKSLGPKHNSDLFLARFRPDRAS